jgi:hypothetical protein
VLSLGPLFNQRVELCRWHSQTVDEVVPLVGRGMDARSSSNRSCILVLAPPILEASDKAMLSEASARSETASVTR